MTTEHITWRLASDKPDSDLTVLCWGAEGFFCGFWDDGLQQWIACESGGSVLGVTHWCEPEGPGADSEGGETDITRTEQRQQAEAERQAAAALAAAAAPAPLPVSEPARPADPPMTTLFAPQPDRAMFPVHPLPAVSRASVPASAEPATLNLGAICARLGFNVTAAFLADSLGIAHSRTDKASKLYRESDWPLICAALVRHIGIVREMHAA